MALHFDFGKVADYQRLTTDPLDENRWHPVADALVWLSLSCGYNHITEKNYKDIAKRIALYQMAGGAYFSYYEGEGDSKNRVSIYITEEDVRRFIGMHTNASTKTAAQFNKLLIAIMRDNPHRATNADGRCAWDIVTEKHTAAKDKKAA